MASYPVCASMKQLSGKFSGLLQPVVSSNIPWKEIELSQTTGNTVIWTISPNRPILWHAPGFLQPESWPSYSCSIYTNCMGFQNALSQTKECTVYSKVLTGVPDADRLLIRA